MKGKSYHVMKEVRIPQGTVLHLSENQSATRSGLKAVGARGWFKVYGEVTFTRGQSLHFRDTPDAITLQALEAWHAWPEPLEYDPCLLATTPMPETYYTVKSVTFLPGTVLRLLPEQAKKREHFMQSLGDRWFNVIEELSFKQGEVLQFRETPRHYLESLEVLVDPLTFDSPQANKEEGRGVESAAETLYAYKAMRPTRIPPGTVLCLTEKQAGPRRYGLEGLKDGGWYRVTDELAFKAGEVLQFAQVPAPRILATLSLIAPLDRPLVKAVAVQKAKHAKEQKGAVMNLSDRQQCALEVLQRGDVLTIQSYKALCPGVSQRTLQRELEAMVSSQLIFVEGKSTVRCYRLAPA